MEVFDTLTPGNDPSQRNIRTLRQYLRRADGEMVPIELSVNRIDTPDSDLIVITFRDISQQLGYEEQIRHNAFYDDLTGLANRALFFDRLDNSLNRRRRGNVEPFAVAFLDLDGFSAVNEGLGHEIGDVVIREVADRLEQTIRPDDTISRFSGDIFAILLDHPGREPNPEGAGRPDGSECDNR